MYTAPVFPDSDEEKIGILLVNLGTPRAPDKAAVRTYLDEFLSDTRVVERPPILWQPILKGIILNTRPKKSAEAYRSVWTDEGSPLLVISKKQRKALQEALDPEARRYKVVLAMRYGSPSIKHSLFVLRKFNARRILVLPLYPQYSATTTASIFDEVTAQLRNWRWLPEMRFINSYADDPDYIKALAVSVRQQWADHGRAQKLLFSFHGIPQDYVDKGDPYASECASTIHALTQELGMQDDEWVNSFQSRLGPTQWLQPYTDETVKKLAQEGVESIDVICPGFSTDCLETIEEIGMENKEYFLEAGGKTFNYIPALNDNPEHIQLMKNLILRHTQGWVP
ncbi:MAG: ferrochelatase [Gammaproteobacteria bacterium]